MCVRVCVVLMLNPFNGFQMIYNLLSSLLSSLSSQSVRIFKKIVLLSLVSFFMKCTKLFKNHSFTHWAHGCLLLAVTLTIAPSPPWILQVWLKRSQNHNASNYSIIKNEERRRWYFMLCQNSSCRTCHVLSVLFIKTLRKTAEWLTSWTSEATLLPLNGILLLSRLSKNLIYKLWAR